jgi:hypothetical protein
MTIISNPVTGPVVGQPIQPGFGQQSAGSAPTNTAIAIPAGMTALEAQGRSTLPTNCLVTSVNGVNVGPGDPCSVSELMTNGNGVTAMHGCSTPPSGGISDQQFASGTAAPTFIENGPTTTNNEPQPLGPVGGAVLVSNLALTANGFAG